MNTSPSEIKTPDEKFVFWLKAVEGRLFEMQNALDAYSAREDARNEIIESRKGIIRDIFQFKEAALLVRR